MDYSADYIFVGRHDGLLATEALALDAAADKAQELAQQYRQPVTYAEVVAYNVEPVKCSNCGEILPPDGACPCSDFGEYGYVPTDEEWYAGEEALWQERHDRAENFARFYGE